MFNKAAKSDAEVRATNLKILENLGTGLASQEEALFLEAGKRLNGWMKNARAYYPEARPKV